MNTQINLPFRIMRSYYNSIVRATGSPPDPDQLKQAVCIKLKEVAQLLKYGIDVGGIKKSVVKVELVSYKGDLYFKTKDNTLYRFWRYV